MFHFKHVARLATVLTFALVVPTALFAQMTRGSIAGTARDASGAVVPGATVTVISVATNAMQVVVTDPRASTASRRSNPGDTP